jgi:uncharacterized membrane protein
MNENREKNHTSGVPSNAAIAGHPLHPLLIPFPIAFFVGAFLTDLAYWSTGDPFWARASLWLVGGGLVGGTLAAVLGLIDFLSIRRAREHAAGWIHFIGNSTVLVLSLVSLLLRWGDPAAAILPWGLTVSAVVAGILVITGWYGGELAYRHMIGVTGHKGK